MSAPGSSAEQGANPIVARALPWESSVIAQIVGLKQRGQLPHAILLEMETSVDSAAFGWQLIKALLCEQVDEDMQPCGQCRACQHMQANSYPDFSYTTLEENERTRKLNRDIKIEQIRRLIHRLALTTSYAAGKYALIYPAERMNTASANSLLKTLEEPSSDTTLVVLTHNAGRLPITIRSRCQRWTVSQPARETAIAWLVQEGMTEQQADTCLQLARGDAQLALQFHQQDTLTHLGAFQQQLENYLANRCSVLTVVDSVKQLAEADVILLIRQAILDAVYQQVSRPIDMAAKQRLQALLQLQAQAGHVLQCSENNLILRLQLEHVLISFRQILTPENQHASTSQPGNPVA